MSEYPKQNAYLNKALFNMILSNYHFKQNGYLPDWDLETAFFSLFMLMIVKHNPKHPTIERVRIYLLNEDDNPDYDDPDYDDIMDVNLEHALNIVSELDPIYKADHVTDCGVRPYLMMYHLVGSNAINMPKEDIPSRGYHDYIKLFTSTFQRWFPEHDVVSVLLEHQDSIKEMLDAIKILERSDKK